MRLSLLVKSCLFIMSGAALAQGDSLYVVTNKADTNTIAVFQQDDSGKYALVEEEATGGKGTGDLEVPALQKIETHPLANGDDPLISANAIAADEDGQFVVSVNPGDATIALSKREDDGTLTFINTVPASDDFPISVAVADDLVVAASIGKTDALGSIGLFKITDGKLTAVENGRRDLVARPSTISFSTNKKMVYVNELVTGKVKVFGIEDGNLSAEPLSVIDSPREPAETRFHAIPVGFVVRGDEDGDKILMSEARFLTPDFKLREEKDVVKQSPLYSWQTSSISTYKVSPKGEISLITGDLLTGKDVEGGEIANCWVELSSDGKTLWAANALSSSISSFDIAEDGSATQKNILAYKDESEETFLSDMALSTDGKQLYQLVGNQGKILIMDIDENDDLTVNHSVSGLPEIGAYGMLAIP